MFRPIALFFFLTLLLLALSKWGATASAVAPSEEARSDPIDPPFERPGISWGDYDGDGLLDAFVLQPGQQGRLLRNQGDGNFEDVTRAVGIDTSATPAVALWRDYDGDGHTDLYLGATGGRPHLYRNLGIGAFEDVAAWVGLAHEGVDRAARWIDHESDGRPDLEVFTEGGTWLYLNRGCGALELTIDGFRTARSPIPITRPAALDPPSRDPMGGVALALDRGDAHRRRGAPGGLGSSDDLEIPFNR